MIHKKTLTVILIISIVVCINLANNTAGAENNKPEINVIYPAENQTISETRPEIKVEYFDESAIKQSNIKIIFLDFDVTSWDETKITTDTLTHRVSEIFELKDGNYTVEIQVTDTQGNTAVKKWRFYVDTSITQTQSQGVDILQIITYILIGMGLGFAVFAAYILYLKKTKKFTFKKYFIQHPMQKEYLVLYLPLATAFIFAILGFAYASSTTGLPEFSYEYIFLITLLIGITPYAIDSIIEKNQILKYERAFSQFLFEMADAMRGGLDPTKAVIELSSTDTGIMKEQLKRASDAIKLGRPFDEVISVMVKPFKSNLIKRYAKLIGEASKVGGETSQVIHRAAKDMDDFIKVSQERRRQLTGQVVTIYISFSVLLVIIYLLITLFPSLEGMNFDLLTSTNLEAAKAQQNFDRMSEMTMIRRFFHVVLVNSIGTGLVIGEFVEGKIKYGLVHIIVMAVASTLFFAIMIF